MKQEERDAIIKVLDRFVEKPKQVSAHKEGDPFPIDKKYEYTGEKRLPMNEEFCVGTHGFVQEVSKIIPINLNIDDGCREILRERKQNQEFHVGQIVFYIPEDGLRRVDSIVEENGMFLCHAENGRAYWTHIRFFRSATPEEVDEWYTRTIDGMPVRAYADDYGCVMFIFEDKHQWFSGSFVNEACAISKALNLPIMPFSESNGKYKPPKPKER